MWNRPATRQGRQSLPELREETNRLNEGSLWPSHAPHRLWEQSLQEQSRGQRLRIGDSRAMAPWSWRALLLELSPSQGGQADETTQKRSSASTEQDLEMLCAKREAVVQSVPAKVHGRSPTWPANQYSCDVARQTLMSTMECTLNHCGPSHTSKARDTPHPRSFAVCLISILSGRVQQSWVRPTPRRRSTSYRNTIPRM